MCAKCNVVSVSRDSSSFWIPSRSEPFYSKENLLPAKDNLDLRKLHWEVFVFFCFFSSHAVLLQIYVMINCTRWITIMHSAATINCAQMLHHDSYFTWRNFSKWVPIGRVSISFSHVLRLNTVYGATINTFNVGILCWCVMTNYSCSALNLCHNPGHIMKLCKT